MANGQTKRYIYDGEDILLEYDGSNVLQARYTHGPGIDEPIAVTKGGSTFFYHQDGLGSVTDLTDSAGATAKSYAYDAYGNILESPGTGEQPYTYTGREFDAESGLFYYRARYYDATTGKFLQKDPLGFLGKDVNLYRYVRNNPTNRTDPTGLGPRGFIACSILNGLNNADALRRYLSILDENIEMTLDLLNRVEAEISICPSSDTERSIALDELRRQLSLQLAQLVANKAGDSSMAALRQVAETMVAEGVCSLVGILSPY